jgi:hypothetical protein
LLGPLISPNQIAFIPQRSIAENVLLAQEVMKNYHKVNGKAPCALKVDLMKAYDSVSWDFALHCLGCFGIPENFVSWVLECITSPQFSVAVNGTLVGFYEGKRGFRRGVPLPPYLFVLTMEVLSFCWPSVKGAKTVLVIIIVLKNWSHLFMFCR